MSEQPEPADEPVDEPAGEPAPEAPAGRPVEEPSGESVQVIDLVPDKDAVFRVVSTPRDEKITLTVTDR
mgnify:CR=1 FL=1